MQRTTTELMQGRLLDDLNDFEAPTFDTHIVKDSFNIEAHFIDSNGKLNFDFLSRKKSFKYTTYNYHGSSTKQEYEYLMQIFSDMGKSCYIREYNQLDFYSCQIIIPTISEIYPIDDLIFNNNNYGKEIRDMVLNYKKYDIEDILISVEHLDDALDMQKYIGVIFENNFKMLEFKAHLHILNGNIYEAKELLEFSSDKLSLIVLELLKMQDRELELEEYKDGLYTIFTPSLVQKALDILDKKEALIDVSLAKTYLDILDIYDTLG
jgi:ribosomal protein S12 methylthiotransferase accessory factor